MIGFRLSGGASLPKYETPGAVGMDVTAQSILKVFKGDEEVTGERLDKIRTGFEERGYIKLRSLERILFGTGLSPKLPNDLELQVRSRSGLALKRGLVVANQPGTVDPDYRGEIGIILLNTTPFLNKVEKGDRIAQLVPKEVIRPQVTQILTEEYSVETDRGSGGFGSTGV
jgi:dUTP pyrophosphatase